MCAKLYICLFLSTISFRNTVVTIYCSEESRVIIVASVTDKWIPITEEGSEEAGRSDA